MVDSIRRTGRIGVIRPSGQLRTVERRQESHKERQQESGNESPTDKEKSAASQTDHQADSAPNESTPGTAANEGQSTTGRCIDVRI
jgi:hypothetical protein